MNTKQTPARWAWQKFGNYYQLTAQHGMREIIIGSLAVEMPMESYPAMNENGLLMPIDATQLYILYCCIGDSGNCNRHLTYEIVDNNLQNRG